MSIKRNLLKIVKLTKRNFTTLLWAAASAKNSKTFQNYKKLIIKLPIFGYDNNRKPTQYCYNFATACSLRYRQQNISKLLKINHKATDFRVCTCTKTNFIL